MMKSIKIGAYLLLLVATFMGSAYAKSFYFFEDMPGMVDANCVEPFCDGGSQSSGGDVSIECKTDR